ncbi:hypothetical protein CLHOM_22620 [Clostridium homopropionicum DSM 5847]|uniref:Uncharacterized protein n=1 Tax=Clostridium homopropionicum DSM 5847 TaxID=1121318 RepID=A0A0L6Z859_9CLOT|nr:hypothetical protein [Clostridium homopropionicum]KOA19156.1 hypothetical protein CLHOM_22620 [Clostridium homopropionicum DSM 5847]SFG15927.1 hypothetical protein SAMN04488501_10618 [Clostridium homopropionicum]
MDKKLKEAIKAAKGLHKKELIYMSDSLDLQIEPNYQVLANIVENLNLAIEKKFYDSIKEEEDYEEGYMLYELALLNFDEKDLISEEDIEFVGTIIKEYVDIEDPILIEDTYVFNIKLDKLQDLYERASKQVEEGKFKRGTSFE